MSTAYVLSPQSILLYYNMLGIDVKDIDFNEIETRVRYLDELSPSALYQYLPESSREIDEQMQLLFERLCTEFGHSEEALRMKEYYYKSVLGILNTVTSLNLLPEEDSNYLLHFERLNSILYTSLVSINSLDISSLIQFFSLVNRNDIENIIKEFMSTVPLLSLLTILAQNPDPETEDYLMFEQDSSKILTDKLVSLVGSPLDMKPNFKPDYNNFKRLSYRQSYEATPGK